MTYNMKHLTKLSNEIDDLYNNRGRLLKSEYNRLMGMLVDADNRIDTLEKSNKPEYAFPKGKDGRDILPGDIVYGEDGIPWAVTSVGLGEYPVHVHTIHKPYHHRHLKAEWLCHTLDMSYLADAMVSYAGSLEPGDTKSAILRWAELINEHEDTLKKNPMY